MSKALKYYSQPAFLLCVAILAIAAGGMSFIQSYFEIWLNKEIIPPRKSFEQLDSSRLFPFEVKDKLKITHKEILDSLGTEDYLQWVLVDSEADSDDATSAFQLFITYYGKADSVPHVPEECYTGGGFNKVSSEPVTFEVKFPSDDPDAPPREIPGQYVVFERANPDFISQSFSFPVLYLFNVNTEYANTRTAARLILGKNIRGKHSYFSKVEMVFNQTRSELNKEEAVKKCQKLLGVLLPVLEQQHWPDMNDLMGREKPISNNESEL